MDGEHAQAGHDGEDGRVPYLVEVRQRAEQPTGVRLWRLIRALRLFGCTGVPLINRRTRINHTNPEDIPGKSNKTGVQ